MVKHLKTDEKYKNYIIIANDFIYANNLNAAFKAYQKALIFADTAKKKIDVIFELANINLINKYYEAAKANYIHILSLDKENSGAYYGLALTNEFLGGDLGASIKNYQKAIALDPKYDRAHYYLAHCYDKLGDTKNAIKHFKICIDIDPMDYISYNDIGSIYEEKKDYIKAKKYFEKSLKINPNYFRALYNMGVIYKAFGSNELALNYYKRAKEEEKNPYIYLNMSAIYIEEKKFKKAIEILNEGISYNEDSVNLFYNRSCSKARLGLFEEALKDLKKAIEINKEAYIWAKKDLDLVEVVKEI